MCHSSTGKIFSGQMKPEWNRLGRTLNAMCGGKMAQLTLTLIVNHGGGGFIVWPGQLAISGKVNFLSWCFAEKLEAICPSIEAQGRMGAATGQCTKNRSNETSEWLQRNNISALDLNPLRCFVVTLRELFTPNISRILLNCNCFEMTNGPKCLLNDVHIWCATTGNV